MGVTEGCLGGLRPTCNECGSAEYWEISLEDYNESQFYWENWICLDCKQFQIGETKCYKK